MNVLLSLCKGIKMQTTHLVQFCPNSNSYKKNSASLAIEAMEAQVIESYMRLHQIHPQFLVVCLLCTLVSGKEVNQRPDATTTASDELDDAQSCLTKVEAIYA